jgi:hypothetical protein
MTTLAQIRNAWEKGTKNNPVEPILVLPHISDGYFVLYVILRKGDHYEFEAGHIDYEYRLNRYFKIGESWEVSVDVDWTENLEDTFARLNVDFGKLMPKELL